MSVVEHKNKLLYIDNQGVVQITTVALANPWFKILYKRDRQSSAKPYFQKCIEFLFYMYHEDSPYIGMIESERLVTIKTTYNLDIDENDEVIKNIGLFLEDSMYTTTQKAYKKAIKELYEFIDYIGTIPFKQEHQVSKTFVVPEGQKEIHVNHTFYYDNISIKADSWGKVLNLRKLAEDFESKCVKEEKKRVMDEKRMFDR